MGNFALTPHLGMEHLAVPGRTGAAAGDPGVEVALCTDRALATVMARKDRGPELARRVADAFGLDLPAAPRRVAAGTAALVWAGPGHWLASLERVEGRAFETRLRAELAEFASVTDQSDARLIVRIGGIRARDTLAKGVMIDLHPRAFTPGDAAVTSVAHVGVHFWQLDAMPTYEFAVPRSFAASFWHWLVESAAEFGVTVR